MEQDPLVMALIENIKEDVEYIRDRMDRSYVTKVEFEPVKKLVYGMVSMILVSVVGAVITLVII